MNTTDSQSAQSYVLLYHRMGLPRLSSLVAGQYVAPSLFASQLDYLSAKGYGVSSMEDVLAQCIGERKPEKPEVAITFDDGYLSVYKGACPLLKEKNLPATLYIVTDTIGGINEWDAKLGDQREEMMTASQIRELSDNGFEIGSHTLSHPHLNELSPQEIAKELSDSKKKLEDIIGKPVIGVSYPYGSVNRIVAEAAENAGYEYAVTTRLGIPREGGNRFLIPRVNVRWNALGPFLLRKMNRAKNEPA